MHNWCQLPQLEVQGIKKMRTRLFAFLKPDKERWKSFMSSPPSSVGCGTPIFHFWGKILFALFGENHYECNESAAVEGPVTLPFLSYVLHLAFSAYSLIFFFWSLYRREGIKCSCSSTACATDLVAWRRMPFQVEMTGKCGLGPPGVKAQPLIRSRDWSRIPLSSFPRFPPHS